MNRAAEFDPKASSDVCPKCGGKLRFERAVGGTGQTVEICENLRMSTVKLGVNVGTCDHWRTLEVLRNPALARAPRGPEPAREVGQAVVAESLRLRKTPRSRGPLAKTERKMLRVLGCLGDTPAKARTKQEVARALGMPVENVYRYLEQLAAEGRVKMQFRRHGQPARPPKEYWACPRAQEVA